MQTVATGMTDELLEAFDRDLATADGYAAGLTERLDRAFKGITADPSRTALVCSWGGDVEVVYRWAAIRDPRLRVTALAGGTLDPRLWRRLSYSRLPLHAAGYACAELIVHASLDDRAGKQLLLAPTLDAGAPDNI